MLAGESARCIMCIYDSLLLGRGSDITSDFLMVPYMVRFNVSFKLSVKSAYEM